MPFEKEEQKTAAQVADLRVAATELLERHPILSIHRYYAQAKEGKVQFLKVPAIAARG